MSEMGVSAAITASYQRTELGGLVRSVVSDGWAASLSISVKSHTTSQNPVWRRRSMALNEKVPMISITNCYIGWGGALRER